MVDAQAENASLKANCAQISRMTEDLILKKHKSAKCSEIPMQPRVNLPLKLSKLVAGIEHANTQPPSRRSPAKRRPGTPLKKAPSTKIESEYNHWQQIVQKNKQIKNKK